MKNVIDKIEKHIQEIRERVKTGAPLTPKECADALSREYEIVMLVNYIDGLSFRTHHGEVLTRLLSQAALQKVDQAPAPAPAAVATTVLSDAQSSKKTITFWKCKGCGVEFPSFPQDGCPDCHGTAFKCVDRPAVEIENAPVKTQAYLASNSAENHREDCKALEADVEAMKATLPPKTLSVVGPPQTRPLPLSAAAAAATPAPISTPATTPSGTATVLSKDFWSCDNAECGSDDLVIATVPLTPNGEALSGKYQCLTCGHIGVLQLQAEEITLARNLAPSDFEIGKDDYHVLARLRENFVKSEQVTPVPVVAESPKKRKKKSESAPSADATTASAATPPTVIPKIQELLASVVGYESPTISQEAIGAELRPQIEAWPLEKLIKEYESLTGQKYVQGTTLPDAMQVAVIKKLSGVVTSE